MGCKSSTFYDVQQFLFVVSKISIGRLRPKPYRCCFPMALDSMPLKRRCSFGKSLLGSLRVANAPRF